LKKQAWTAALAAVMLGLGGCGSSASEQNSNMLAEAQSSPEQTDYAAVAAQNSTVQPKRFTPRETSIELIAQAKIFQGCSLAAGALAAVFFNSDQPLSETLTRDVTTLHKIGVGYAVLSGLDIETAKAVLQSKQYPETEMLSQLSEGTNVDANMQMLMTSYQYCIGRIKNGQGDDTLIYIVRNF